LGIGGVGMSGVALLLRSHAVAVSGSDLRESPLLRKVRSVGCAVSLQPDPESVSLASWLIVPDAVPDGHPEVAQAAAAGLLVLSREEALKRILSGTEKRGVCGVLNRGGALHGIVEALQDPDVGCFSGAIPRNGQPHARLGVPMFVELDERFVEDLSEYSSLLVADCPPDSLGYASQADPIAHLRALAKRSGTLLIYPEKDAAHCLRFASSRGSGRFRLRYDGVRRVVRAESSEGVQEVDLGASLDLFHLRNVAAVGAYLHLAEGWSGARLIEGMLRASHARIVGQFEVRAHGERRFIHDVRTHPIGVRAIVDAAETPKQGLQVVLRPYPFTFNAYGDAHWCEAFKGVGRVQLLPAYPGGRGDEGERLAKLLSGIGVQVLQTDEYCSDPEFATTLFIGGEDLAALADAAAAVPRDR